MMLTTVRYEAGVSNPYGLRLHAPALELPGLQYRVELLVVPVVEGHRRLGPHYAVRVDLAVVAEKVRCRM